LLFALLREKNEIKPWQVKEWCIPQADVEFVAKMEDALEVYQRPYDPLKDLEALVSEECLLRKIAGPGFLLGEA